MKNNRILTAIMRALLLGAPFLLISIAVVILTSLLLSNVLEENIYYRVATASPEMTNSDGGESYANLTVEERKEIQNNNYSLPYPDFPVIMLGEQFATITIESAGVNAQPVFHGDYEDLLMRGIGHYENSRFPGQHGKVVLAGHVGISRLFQRLETMQVGDLVTLDTTYGQYVYRVTATYIFDVNDPALVQLVIPDEEDTGDRLIAYTCYPFRTTSVRTQRFVIDCELISGYDWLTEEEVSK